MLRDTEANELSVLDILRELRIELSSLLIIIGILNTRQFSESFETLSLVLPVLPGLDTRTLYICQAPYQMESYSRLIPSLNYQ